MFRSPNKWAILIVLVVSLCQSANAQNVGINSSGSAPDATAGLDVDFSNKGLLIPRVALTATNAAGPITTPTTSLLVYNTATAGSAPNNVTPGYYFWTGTAWSRLSNGTQGGWDLQGNTGTSATNNFVGTTDAVDLVLKTGGTERLRLENSSGDLKIGSATTGTLRATQELVMRQDGDTYGPSILRLRNRNAENGAIFETTDPTVTLVDFIFKTNISQSNIRMEGRVGSTFTAAAPEWQFGDPGNPTFVTNHAGTYTFVRRGNFGVGIAQPSALIHLKAGTATASSAPLKFTSGTNLTTPEAGAVEFDGTNYFVTSSTVRYTLAKTLIGSATLDFGNTSTNISADLTISVTGAATTDFAIVNPPAANANTCYTAWVSAANTVTVRFNNYSAASVNPASGTFRVTVLKY
ncbi:MAG: hypothetical protein K9I48_06200 [Sphingobacteriales bacterium]|nr:hypothetical protein [Sphingobacteriales bacterium]